MMAYANEAQVNADIKNNDFRYCYIVFGEDRFLKKRIVEKLSSSVADKDDFFNFYMETIYFGTTKTHWAIIEMCNKPL